MRFRERWGWECRLLSGLAYETCQRYLSIQHRRIRSRGKLTLVGGTAKHLPELLVFNFEEQHVIPVGVGMKDSSLRGPKPNP